MGQHQPSPRTPAQHTKRKRTIVLTAAAGAVLIAGGTAGAAVLSDAAPQAAQNRLVLPDAKTAAPQAPASAAPSAGTGKEPAKAEAQESARSSSADLEPELDKPEPAPETEKQKDGAGGGTDTSGLTPSGDGGSCEASMYSDPQPTASGETFDPSAMTAAHKTLPMDTMVKVTNPSNGKSVTVRINDRGPYIAGRCLDLSTASFTQIASAGAGVTDVDWQVVS